MTGGGSLLGANILQEKLELTGNDLLEALRLGHDKEKDD